MKLLQATALASACLCTTLTAHAAESAPRIVNGENAKAGAYPWMVELRWQPENNGKYYTACGGSLISPSWVLTAAHCVTNREGKPEDANNYEAKLNNLRLDDPKGERIKIKRILVHPQYDSQTTDNDVALMELKKASTQPTVSLLSKQTANIPVGTQAVVAGWGVFSEPPFNFLMNMYINDPRVKQEDIDNIDQADPEFPFKFLDILTGTSGIPEKEILKVLLTANQLGFKKETDSVADFLNKAIPENTPGFKKLANRISSKAATFDAWYDDLIAAGLTFKQMVIIIAFGDPDADLDTHLQQVSLPIVSNRICNRDPLLLEEPADGEKAAITDNMLCAGFAKGGKAACFGDSGGPLVIWNGQLGKWTQVGIVSWGIVCARRGGYNVYARVSAFHDLIQTHVPDARLVKVDFSDNTKCVPGTTPIPFKPELEVNIQGNIAKGFWEPVSYAERYTLAYAPYSYSLIPDNFEYLDMGDQTIITVTLPSGTDLYVTVRASNCSSSSGYFNMERVLIK